MFLISSEQHEKLAQLSLNNFYSKLCNAFTKNDLLPNVDVASASNEKLIKKLVQEARDINLEYEVDIAFYIAFVLCGQVASEHFEVSYEQNDDIFADHNTSINKDNYLWISDLLLQVESDGDERMSIIESRWRRFIVKNKHLKPSIELLEALETEF